MAFYAQTGNVDGLVDQDGLRAKRQIAETLKRIEQQQACVMTNLQIWLRSRDQQALERLMEARQQENVLFRQLLNIADDLLDIAKQFPAESNEREDGL